MLRQVELGSQVRILADADLAVIERHDEHGFGRAHVQHDTSVVPVGRELELALIEPGRVRFGHVWRLAHEGHLDVGVVRLVEGVLHGPAAGNLDLAPLTGVGTGVGIRSRQQLETPSVIEQQAGLMRHRVHRLAASRHEFRI